MPAPLWTPSPERIHSANLTAFGRGRSYTELYAWSVEQPLEFWLGRLKDASPLVREESLGVLTVIGDKSQLGPFVRCTPPAASALMNAFWPGPLTIVFPAAVGLSDSVTAGTGSVGIRLSAWHPLQDLLSRVGPTTGTSANREGAPPPTTAEEVQHSLGDALDLIIDAGPTPGGLPSTVIDIQGPIRIIRNGMIERAAIVTQLAACGLHLDEDSR